MINEKEKTINQNDPAPAPASAPADIDAGPRQSFIRFNSVNYKAGEQTLLHEMSFELEAGGVTALVGLNGAGKSTLLKVASGELKPTSGEVTIDDLSPVDNRIKQKLGYQASTMQALPVLTVKEYLRFAFALKNIEFKSFSKLLDDVVCQWNLDSVLNKQLSRLSQGNLQKVMIAQAFIGEPDFILLDEPSQALDPVEQQRLSKNLSRLSKTQYCLFTSHHVSEIVASAARVLLIDSGRLIALLDLENEFEHWVLIDNREIDFLRNQERPIETKAVFRSRNKTLVSINHCYDDVKKELNKISETFSSIRYLGMSRDALMPLFNLLANREI